MYIETTLNGRRYRITAVKELQDGKGTLEATAEYYREETGQWREVCNWGRLAYLGEIAVREAAKCPQLL